LIVSLFFLSLFDSVIDGGGIMVGMLFDVLGNRDIVLDVVVCVEQRIFLIVLVRLGPG
jgi:hypothetical protein